MDLALISASNEIERLKSLGFVDWQADSFGVRLKEAIDHRSISFPEEVYQSEELTRESFWSCYRVEVLASELKKSQVDVILELGGGDGRVSIPLISQGFGVISIEPFYDGCRKVARYGIPIFCGTIENLDLPQESIGAIGFFDVLEHIEDESGFLSSVQRTLSPQGKIYLTVPAHDWLFSDHDEALGHHRRYSRKTLKRTLEESGFTIERIDFLFSVLILPAMLLRRMPYLFGMRKDSKVVIHRAETVLRLPFVVDRLMLFVCRIERFLKLPFGLSLFVVASKK